MAPKIKFALKLGEASVRTVEGIRDNFRAKDILAYYESGRLRAWLEIYGFEEERKRLDALVKTETPADKVKALAKVFGIPEGDATVLASIQEMETEKKRQEEEREKVKKAAAEALRAHVQSEQQEPSSTPKGPMDWRAWFKAASASKRKLFFQEHSFASGEEALRTVNHLFANQEEDLDHIKVTIDLFARLDVFKSDDRAFTYFLQALQATKNALVASALWLNQTLSKRCRANQKFFTQWAEKGDFLQCLGTHLHDVLLSKKEPSDDSLSYFSPPEMLVKYSNFLAIALYVGNSNVGNLVDQIELDFGLLGKRDPFYWLSEGYQWLWLWKTGKQLAYRRPERCTHGDPKYRLIYVEF